MKRHSKRLFTFVRTLMRARKGRPVALVVLFSLSLLNLCSDWPNDIDRPAFVDAIDKVSPISFGTARRILFDQYQRRFPRIPASQPVTIVQIDEKTLAAVGQWPWPRNRLAVLIDAIAAQKPLAIGLDVYMPEPDQTSPDKVADNLPKEAVALAAGLRALPSHEAILAKSLRAAPTVLGAAAFDQAAFTTSTDLRSAPIVVHGADPLRSVQRFNYVLASLPELQAAAHGQAMLNVPLERGVVRRIPLVMGLGEKLVPSLPIEMLRVATGSPVVDVFADSSGVRAVGVADVQVPTQPDGDIWLHFASIQSTQSRYVSALDILQGKVDANRIRNKLVLVGLTGTGLTDMRTTPLGDLVPGIEIQAQVIETIFEGSLLRRPVWLKWAESASIMALGLLIIWYVPRSHSRLAVFLNAVPKASVIVGVLLNLLILSSGIFFFRYFGLLVDAASIFIILSAVMGGFYSSVLLHEPVPPKPEAARVPVREDDGDGSGKAPGAGVA